ncbi:MAG: hypothetical protein HY908_00965 [Myxococcales bacterium]|nr:hypothetical protein [Myxococcales bacterium]
MRPLAWSLVLAAGLALAACRNDGAGVGPPPPATSDPEGKDLVEGAVVAATEKTGGIRILKVMEVNFFPPPMGDEIVFTAFKEMANDFQHASDLWTTRRGKGLMTVEMTKIRVQRQQFRQRDYRVIAAEPVTPEEKLAAPDAGRFKDLAPR